MNFNTLIHIGCGPKVDFRSYVDVAQNIVLIDADTEITKQLKTKTGDSPNISVLDYVVAPQSNKCVFYRYNLSWANGLSFVSDEVQRLYPSLRCIEQVPSQAVSIKKILCELLEVNEFESESRNVLLLDLAHMNDDLLKELDGSKVLDLLDKIVIFPMRFHEKLPFFPSSLFFSDGKNRILDLPDDVIILEKNPLICQLRESLSEIVKRNEALQFEIDFQKKKNDEIRNKFEENEGQFKNKNKIKENKIEEMKNEIQNLRSKIEKDNEKNIKEMRRLEGVVEKNKISANEIREKNVLLNSNMDSLNKKNEALMVENEKFEERLLKLNEIQTELKLETFRNKNNKSRADFFQNLDRKEVFGGPFLLIDSKSLPRSGLHYFKNTLSWILGDQFSFCEWYQEPGCCKSYPCQITSFSSFALDKKKLRVRLIKSHDFGLNDPYIESTLHYKQVVLVREPIFILTSWFLLSQFERYKKDLISENINMDKINLYHEKEVVIHASKILDRVFEPVINEDVEIWLKNKATYIDGFLSKWSSFGTEVINYKDIDFFILKMISPYVDSMSKESLERFDFFSKGGKSFNAREDPFLVKSEKVSSFIKEKEDLFLKAAENIKLSL